jgi:signal transduction histidine kinase
MSDIKILIVEDELLIAKNLARKLEKLGYRVVDIVSSGSAALQRAAEKKPDLILMDIVIKGELDGIETAAKINERLNIPVIYTTAYADDYTLGRAEKTGSYGYAIKPFKERELHATIKMALSKHQEAVKMRELLAAAEILNQNQAQYISIASHDLRTPLATIQMSADMLQLYDQRWDETKKNKHFERIQTAIANMNQMLEDILILSKVESGKLIFEPTPVDAIAFCRALVEELQPLTTPQQFLIFHQRGECSQAFLDEKLLRHILTNLLINAIKYSPDGDQISLETINEPQQIIFRIQDRGIGIPIEDQGKLFKQFERASNVGNIPGTGLGLCIVKQAVDLHGGQIAVESIVGVGTTFTVILPSYEKDSSD